MPLHDPSPNFALISSFDARQWSGVTVFEQLGYPVTIPTFAAGAGVYEDALFFLNGRSSASSLTEMVSALATFGSDWKVEVNADDLLEISNASTAFSIAPIGDDVFGWGTQTASVVGGRLVVTADLDWMRGLYLGGRFTLTSGGGSFIAPYSSTGYRPRQDIMTLLRNRGVTSDADELYSTTCLEALHESAFNSSSSTVFWLINDDGHVEAHYPALNGAITWLNSSFRDRLGFSGSEVAVGTSDSYVKITADRPLPGALFPSRPYQAHFYSVETESTARRLLGGGYVSNFLGSYVTSNLTFDLDALLDQKDLYRHFTEGFLPYCGEGERINFYQGWGDSRRALRSGLVSSSQPAYDLLYTSENNGDLGRLRCSMRSTDFDLSFGALKKRVPVTVSLEHL
jgi:PAS domain-containing protein